MTFRILAVAALLCALASCAEYRVRVPDSDPTDTQYKEKTMHAYLWGTYKAPLVLSADCEGEGINDIGVVDNWGYDLIGVITLGFYKPIDIRYRCKAPGGSGSTTFPVPESESDSESESGSGTQ